MDKKSFIFILLVLAMAAVVFYLVWLGSGSPELAGLETLPVSSGQKEKMTIEATNIADFDAEMEEEMESFDSDLSDLIDLDADSSLADIEKDLADFNL